MSARIRGLSDFLALVKGVKRARDGQYMALCPGHQLRCSEAVGMRPCGIARNDTGWVLRIKGKGGKAALVAISPNLVAQLQAYAYCHKLHEYDRFFPITRSQAFRIVIQAFDLAGISKPRRDGKGGLSARTVHKHHRIIFAALRYAIKHNFLVRNPAEIVDPPRPQSSEVTKLGANDVQLILDAANGTPYYAVLFTAAYTGLRRGELLGLRWCDVDLPMATLSVVQTLQVLRSGERFFKEPKTRRSRRQIALLPDLALLLTEHRLDQEDAGRLLGKPLAPHDLVFSQPDGRPLRPNTLTRFFQTIAKEVGLNDITLHSLRHAHATILLQCGVHPKVVQERLGHSSIATTLDIYSHVVPGLQESAARQFDEGLKGILSKTEVAQVN